MVDMSKEVRELTSFSSAMDNQLGEFEFPEDFVTDVWTAITTARARET